MQHLIRNQLANYVCGLIDAGSAAGSLIFRDAQGVQVAQLTFSKPAFKAANNGTAAANLIGSDTSAEGGTVSSAVAQDSNGNQIFSCTVSNQGGAGDIQLNSTLVAVGQQVSLNALSYTAPP